LPPEYAGQTDSADLARRERRIAVEDRRETDIALRAPTRS
jgi:hypothetical protein